MPDGLAAGYRSELSSGGPMQPGARPHVRVLPHPQVLDALQDLVGILEKKPRESLITEVLVRTIVGTSPRGLC